MSKAKNEAFAGRLAEMNVCGAGEIFAMEN